MNLVLLAIMAVQHPLRLKPHLSIGSSTTIVRRTYPIATENLDPAIKVEGSGLTIDFGGATLEGSPQTTEPDKRKGLGLSISGKNITIKNLRVRGYKVGIIARNCPGLKLIDCDLSYNWKKHLASTLEREDESDWQSYHRNEKDQWLEYGAGIYLRGCNGFEIRDCKAEGGQCGLMMTECNKGLVWNSDFSFLSGIGIGMYKCSDNRIMHNKIDWCVRGFSYGVYNRGQDSAGILIYEQSNRNVFAYNSVTHGGDGFFLWAGQTTMDTGEGGCNDNLLYGNDFSHAVTNGIEATFSRNNFVNNLILECWHGIWGGYGFDSKVIGNFFGYNSEAISWEHGQNNSVANNFLYEDNEGVVLWADPHIDPNWGYAKTRDVRSRDWLIKNNWIFGTHSNVFRLNNTLNAEIDGNTMIRVGRLFTTSGENKNARFAKNKIDGVEGALNVPQTISSSGNSISESIAQPEVPVSSLATKSIQASDYEGRANQAAFAWRPFQPWNYGNLSGGVDWQSYYRAYTSGVKPFAPKPLEGGNDPFLKAGAVRGWRYILVDEWGPYDFKRPLLLQREGAIPKTRFEILGPRGKWRVARASHASFLSESSGTVPGSAEIEVANGGNVDIELEYVGSATTDYRGIVTPAGKPVRFGYHKFFFPIEWTIRFHKWSKSTNPNEPHANPSESELQAILKEKPLKEIRSDKLDFAGSSFDPVTGNDHFLTTADGSFTVDAGDYTLEMTADDGARLWLDGKPLIQDAWHYQGPTLYSRNVHLSAGRHVIRVEHFQIDGYAALKVNLRPKR